MHEAYFYERLKKDVVECMLCPHECVIKDDAVGRCHVRKNVGGTLYSLNYGKILGASYDPIEKKPLSKYKPHHMIFSIGSVGCNFICDFCQNWESVYYPYEVPERTTKEIVQLASEKGSIGLAYTYNEPTVWYEFMIDTAKEIKQKKLDNVVVTNGYINPKPLEKLLPFIDAMNIDLKAFNKGFYKNICGGSLEPVKKTIELAAPKTHVEISTLLIDDENTSDEEIERLAKFLASIDPQMVLHLNRYYPAYKRTDQPTKVDTIFRARDIALRYLKNVEIGNVPGI